MGLRIKALFLGACLSIYTSMASALGLGELELHSSLNQPLKAEVPLLQADGLTEEDIVIALASAEEFARSGVDRSALATSIKLALVWGPKGPKVLVTSQAPVTEPFLNFILAAQWPSGRLLREYTVLLDLPIFSGEQASPVQAAPKYIPPPKPVNRPTASAKPKYVPKPAPEASSESSNADAYRSDTFGPVSGKDTLWGIASKVRGGSGASIQQVMLALQRANPGAFINDNINLLRKGQVLRIPDEQEFNTYNLQEAAQQVAEQNNRWSQKASQQDSEPQLEASKKVSQSRKETPKVEGRVKLMSGNKSTATGQAAGQDGSGEQAGSRAELAQTQEELDAASRQNADLKSRVNSMEEQIETMEKLVDVTSNKMHALQETAKKANASDAASSVESASLSVESTSVSVEGTSLAATSSLATESPDATASAAATANTEEAATSTMSETTASSAVSSVAASAPAKPAPVASKPDVSAIDQAIAWAKANLLIVGGALVALLLAIGLVLYNKFKDDGFSDDDFDQPLVKNGVSDYSQAHSDLDQDHTQPFVDINREEATWDEPIEAETEDVVGECDIHIAYGQYDQAEEKLVGALTRNPDDVSIRLKLMEVYAAMEDGLSFDEQFDVLHRLGNRDVIERASAMRESIPNLSPFVVGALTAASSSQDAFDLPLADDDLAIDGMDDHPVFDQPLDLDLDLPSDDDITRIQAVKPVSASLAPELADLDVALDQLDLASPSLNLASPSTALESSQFGDLELDFDELEQQDRKEDMPSSELAFESNIDFESPTPEAVVAHKTLDEFDHVDDDLDSLRFDESEFELPQTLNEAIPNLTTQDLASRDFDLDVDLEKPVNLDALDHELDALAADTLPHLATLPEEVTTLDTASAVMDEPITDFDDFDLGDLDSDFMPSEPLDQDTALDGLVSEEASTLASGLDDLNLDDLNLDVSEASLDLDTESFDFDAESLDLGDELLGDDLNKADALTALAPTKDQPASPLSDEIGVAEAELDLPDFDPDFDDDSNLDFLTDSDETATKLDLARAYIDMGDADGAKDILDEIMEEGNDDQKKEATELLGRIG